MFKTFIAVWICLYINLLLWEDGIPFYSAIAAILCMQPDVPNSMKAAVNRTIGTFIGGLSGMAVLVLERQILPADGRMLQYLLVSLCVIPLIYMTVLVKKPGASYITCVVFLSITISHTVDASPHLFAVNRILDTLLGVFVSLGVNLFHLPRRRNRELLLIGGMEGTLLNDKDELASYTKIKLNDMLKHGAHLTVSTNRTPAELLPLLADVECRLPVMAMKDAALYDLKEEKYTATAPIAASAVRDIRALLDGRGQSFFSFAVINDVLHVYYKELSHAADLAYYERMKRLPHQHYLCGETPAGEGVLQMLIWVKREDADDLLAGLKKLDDADRLRIAVREDESAPETGGEAYVCLEIHGQNTVAREAVAGLKAMTGARTAAVFGSGEGELALAAYADSHYVPANGAEAARNRADHVIGDNNGGAVVKTMYKLFYSGNKRRSGGGSGQHSRAASGRSVPS